MKKLLRQPQHTNVRVRVVGALHKHPIELYIPMGSLVPSMLRSKVQAVAKNFFRNLRTVAKKIAKAKEGCSGSLVV